MSSGLAIHGRGKEALELLETMKTYGVKTKAVTFTSLLSACCHVGLVEEGLHLFDMMKASAEKSTANLTVRSEDYVALSNVYERWKDVEMVREEMKA
ncbi:pentatricopeptide repeat-containing protein, partial [Quercus suber]